MEDNYDYKYSDREYQVMMLKKQLKDQVKPGSARQEIPADGETLDMNELHDSDDDLDYADGEGEDNHSTFSSSEENDVSFEDEDVFKEILKECKKTDPKINNSFTGPYPLDPTDFNHNDQGTNPQFNFVLWLV